MCRPRPPSFLSYSVKGTHGISFLPKIISDFHLSAEIIFLDFFPNPFDESEHLFYTLDIKRTLLFYLVRIKFSNRAQQVLVPIPQRLQAGKFLCKDSKWFVETIKFCYGLEKIPLPPQTNAPSTTAVAASMAFLHGVTIQDICNATFWAIFIHH